ncbi:unnamed protein product [Pylaiella littoralis]
MDVAATKRILPTYSSSGVAAAVAAATAAAAGARSTSSTSAGSAGSSESLRSPFCLESSAFSPAMVGAAPPRRHRRVSSPSTRGVTAASGSGSALIADGEVLRPSRQEASGEEATRPPLSSALLTSPFPDASQKDSPSLCGRRRDGDKSHYYVSRNTRNGTSGTSSSNNGFRPRPWRRITLERLFWIFWRRRAGVGLRACLSHRSAKLLRRPWGRRLVTAASIVFVALLWFLAITAVVGPAGGNGSLERGGTAGGKKGGDPGGDRDGDRHRSYYRRIVGEVAVGPSLSDPWKVREIDIAAADWGLGGDGPSDGGGVGSGSGSGSGDSGDSGSGVSSSRDDAQGGGVRAGGSSERERGVEEWDGRVNGVITGALEPVGGAKTRPKVDLLLTIFSGRTEADAAKRDLLRQIYDRYEGWISVGGPNSITGGTNPVRRQFTVSVVFVVSNESAPPEGELVGDILYVNVADGYRNIVRKTRAMLYLVRHFDFQFLLKADDDSFVCLARIASMLHDLDPDISSRIYAGVPTACNQVTNTDYWNGRVMKDMDHRWFDTKYLQHTLGGLDCFPAYMQGAFYILAQPLVEHLFRGHEHLECFTNEDVTMGSWLMGVDREMVEMYNLRTSHIWDCLCARAQITTQQRQKQKFFHNCKGMSQLKLCGTRLLRPGIGC